MTDHSLDRARPRGGGDADRDADRGRHADRPVEIPKRGWVEVLKRTWSEQSRDNVSIVAAGVAFLSLLAVFPAMSAIVSLYGLVADPSQIERRMQELSGVLPSEAFEILSGQMRDLAGQAGGALSFGLALSVLLALWSAAGGVRSLMTALNIAYDEEEKRGFIAFAATALALTLGFILLMFVTLAVVIILPAVVGLLGLGQTAEWLVRLMRWPILAAALVLALAVLYRYGPSRATPKWRWVTPGAAVATGLWLLGSIAFSVYITNFADYNATYGALGGAIILLLWLYLGAYAVLLGAELDAEIEHQTARDSTTGPDRPMGDRGAHVADTLGR
ncbi:MAG: ribonuclease family protein [Pseudomonadota bacterium]|jgi:membrane protein